MHARMKFRKVSEIELRQDQQQIASNENDKVALSYGCLSCSFALLHLFYLVHFFYSFFSTG